ncbi:MAG: transglycosylase domain-containing protein [bacterium]|nr:transglycosylase domain-containing protein [bacterium]
MDIVTDKILAKLKTPRAKKVLVTLVVPLVIIGLFLYILDRQLITAYKNLESVVILDRNGEIIAIKPNNRGNYARYVNALPEHFKKLLVQKEDRFFYFHFGINPISVFRALVVYLKSDAPGASSTITQQLAKGLLGNEQNRTFENKVVEMFYTAALELFFSKERILTMYGNTVYMGNQMQGVSVAALGYFGKKPEDLTSTEILSLLATISSPSSNNPWKKQNRIVLTQLGKKLGLANDPESLVVKKSFQALSSADFELESLGECKVSCTVTLDKDITDTLRKMLANNLSITSSYGGRNGAIVVIKLPENELLAVVGTSDTRNSLSGSAINMALEPRPIGSTVKPFIYLKAFEKGLRPYTLVDDREYKFSIANGFPLYPKNYDGAYHGVITLHEALSNSLNVPTVKTLEYVTLSDFYSFLERELMFKPLQPIESYQYGIALGGLEMDPLTLAHLMTIFTNHGELQPLKLFISQEGRKDGGNIVPPMEADAKEKRIADEQYVQLVNKITSDRLAGVEEFGLAGNLNLTQSNYSVKTGTSRDFHDTWTIGFTPDFLVAVWLGNVENEPMRQITSASGAGKIWHDAMELLLNSEYNKKTPLDFSKLTAYEIANKLEFGLPNDDVKMKQNLLSDKSLIINPHEGDTFSFESGMQIPLKSNSPASWYSDEELIGRGETVSFYPSTPKTYSIRAITASKEESVTIRVVSR